MPGQWPGPSQHPPAPMHMHVLARHACPSPPLVRYKESLGLTASSGALNVLIHEMRITPQDGTDPIVIPLATPADVEAANALKLTVKQGVDFVVRCVSPRQEAAHLAAPCTAGRHSPACAACTASSTLCQGMWCWACASSTSCPVWV